MNKITKQYEKQTKTVIAFVIFMMKICITKQYQTNNYYVVTKINNVINCFFHKQ